MFGISSFEFLMILLIGVVVLGPEKLPRIMRTVNKAMSEFRRIRTELHRTVNLEIANQEHEERKREAEAELLRDEKTSATPRYHSEAEISADNAAQAQLDRPKTDSLHVNMDGFTAQVQPRPSIHASGEMPAQNSPTPEAEADTPSAGAVTDDSTIRADEKAQQ